MAVTAYPNRTAPTIRGKWVLEQLLGTPPPPPPPNVPALKIDENQKVLTMRQRMEEHRVSPQCAVCHRIMDPIGFALDNFDGLGKWRVTEGEEVIDPSGVLPDGTPFEGPVGLRDILVNKKRDVFVENFTERLLTYALGRGTEFAPIGAGGALTELPRTLQPLADFKDRLLVFSGLDNQQAAGLSFETAGDHPRACTAWLTGTHAKMTAGADLHAGVSVDQIAAKEFGKETQLASLEVSLESADVLGSCEAAYSCAYYNTISWRDDTTPMPMESRPRALFERLFGTATDPKTRAIMRQEDRSILDAINEDAKRLRIKLGAPDRGKIDQYLDAVRDVERRIQRAEAQSKDHVLREMAGPAGTPSSWSDYYKLMTDLMVLAWQTDMTRVCTFHVGHEMSLRAYPELG